MGDIPEEVISRQATGLCEHSQLCVGHTSGKLSCNIITGVTVLMTQSVTHILPSGLHKVHHTLRTCMQLIVIHSGVMCS